MTRILNISGGSSNLEYQTEITSSLTLSTQKGLNKVYPVNSSSAVVITVPTGYALDDVINIERRGSGSVEIVPDSGVLISGVRNIDNRYFINDKNSLVQLRCKATNEWVIDGNLTRGYTGAIVTSTYGNLAPGDTNKDVTVTGTGFSANITVSVSANATLNSFTFVNNNQIILNLDAVGGLNDTVTVTYWNGDETVDVDAITISNAIPTDDLRHYYRLSSNANDFKDTLDGTSTNMVYNSDYADFNGTDAYVTLPDSDSLSYGDGATDEPMSFSAMIWFDDLSGFQPIFGKGITSTNLEYRWDINSSTEMILQCRDQVINGTRNGRYNPYSFVTGQWYHVVITKDAGTSFQFYVNGTTVTTSQDDAGVYNAMGNEAGVARIGGASYDTNTVFNGRMKGLGLWNKVLSASEVSAIDNKQRVLDEQLL